MMGLTAWAWDGWMERVGWALVHFLWQGLLAALVLWVVLQWLRRRSPQARWLASCMTLGVMAMLPAATVCLTAQNGMDADQPRSVGTAASEGIAAPAGHETGVMPEEQPPLARSAGPVAPDSPPVVKVVSADAPAPAAEKTIWSLQTVEELVHPRLPWILRLWAIGVACLSVWHLGGWLALQRRRRTGARPAGAAIQRDVARLARTMGVGQVVSVLESAFATVPAVIGWLRPAILLPVGLATGLDRTQLEAVIAHELAHIRRLDNLVRLFQAVVETLLFYHPAVWWVSGRIRQEAENCCDDAAMEACGNRRQLADALVKVAELGHSPSGLTAAANGGKLLPRIRRILGADNCGASRPAVLPALTGLFLLAMVVMVPLLTSQTPVSGQSDPAGEAAPPAGPDEKHIADLIVLLGDEDSKVREQAQDELVEIGQPAMRQLRQATGDKDAERANRAKVALGIIWQGLRPTMRLAAYSLADEPQRVKPRTLGKDKVSPAQAVILGSSGNWWASHWEAKPAGVTSSAGMEELDRAFRFIVAEPHFRKVWVRYFDVPVNSERYPILVLTYRATNTEPYTPHYVLYLDDGSGPDYGGLLPVAQQDIIPDGKTHTLTYDTRLSKPLDDFIGLALGVQCGGKGPAVFDLVDLRFESDLENAAPVAEDKPLKVTVTQQDEAETAPAKDAQVTIDAEWVNWARGQTTDADGLATVTPLKTFDGRHMLRVTKPGFAPVEIREVNPNDREIKVLLEPAAAYGGVVQDENNRPVPGASVHIAVAAAKTPGQWVRTNAVVLTDEKGRWASPPLPRNIRAVQIALAHPAYTHGQQMVGVADPDADKLRAGQAVLVLKSLVKPLTLQVVNDEGKAVAGARVRAVSGGLPRISDADGKLTVTLSAAVGADMLLIQHDDYAPKVLANVTDQTDVKDGKIVLEKGLCLTGQVVGPDGKPLAGVVLEGRDRQDEELTTARMVSDKEGRFVWAHAPSNNPQLKATKAGCLQEIHPLNPQRESQEIKLKPLPETPPAGRERDPSYDPSRIFRQIG